MFVRDHHGFGVFVAIWLFPKELIVNKSSKAVMSHYFEA